MTKKKSRNKVVVKNAPSKEELIDKINEEVENNIIRTRPILETDLFKFNRFALEIEKGKDAKPMAPVHQEICEFIDKNKKKKKLLLIPRGHLKSTIVTVGRTLQAILQDHTKRVLIANANFKLACGFLTDIKRHLKFNEKIHMFWGDLSATATEWNRDSITLAGSTKKEPTVTAKGVESDVTSQHYDIIILDDLVNDKFVNTQDQIQKTIDFYKETLNLLEPGGEVIIVGTRWHYSDLYGWIMDKDNSAISDFDVFIRQAYKGELFGDGDIDILFPEKFSRKHLQNVYNQLGPYFFSTQYMNEPIADEDATFKRDWFKYYDSESLRGKLLNKFTVIDPAISTEKEADFTAMITVGVDEFRNIFILDIVRKRLKPADLIDTLFQLWGLYSPIKIGLEDVAFQKSLQYSITEEMHKRGVYLPIQPLQPGGRNKDQRISGLQPLYANGKIFHSKEVNNIQQLEDELLRFPRNKHDDCIDALAYIIDLPIYPPRRKSSRPRNRRYLYA